MRRALLYVGTLAALLAAVAVAGTPIAIPVTPKATVAKLGKVKMSYPPTSATSPTAVSISDPAFVSTTTAIQTISDPTAAGTGAHWGLHWTAAGTDRSGALVPDTAKAATVTADGFGVVLGSGSAQAAAGSGTITVTPVAPLAGGGAAVVGAVSTTLTVSIPAATSTTPGYATTAQISKLDGITAGAHAKTIAADSSDVTVTDVSGDYTITVPRAVSGGVPGLMMGADKAKLDGIGAGAQPLTVLDESAVQGTATTSINWTGADVTVTYSNGRATVTIANGIGGVGLTNTIPMFDTAGSITPSIIEYNVGAPPRIRPRNSEAYYFGDETHLWSILFSNATYTSELYLPATYASNNEFIFHSSIVPYDDGLNDLGAGYDYSGEKRRWRHFYLAPSAPPTVSVTGAIWVNSAGTSVQTWVGNTTRTVQLDGDIQHYSVSLAPGVLTTVVPLSPALATITYGVALTPVTTFAFCSVGATQRLTSFDCNVQTNVDGITVSAVVVP